jgi:hypothetical protein
MPSYDSFMCPNCEGHFRVIWPEPIPSHFHKFCKIKIKCPDLPGGDRDLRFPYSQNHVRSWPKQSNC